MKMKAVTIALLVGLLGLNASAGFEQFGDTPTGSINQYSLGNSWEQWMSWGLSDVISLTDDNRTFTLKPNISAYISGTSTDPDFYNNGFDDGTKKFDGMTVFEHTLAGDDYAVHVDLTVNSNSLDPRYVAKMFLVVIDPSNDYQPDPSFTRVETTLTTSGTYTIDGIPAGLAGEILQVGLSLYGQNAAPSNSWGSINLTLDDMYVTSTDITPPMPNPPTFVGAAPISDSAISVSATPATDDYHGVQYWFTNLTAGVGSGWISTNVWVDVGPSAGITTENLPVVNVDFAGDLGSWNFSNGSQGGAPAWLSDSGNGTVKTTVNGNIGGGWSLVFQEVLLADTGFSEGSTVNLSADIKALVGQNGGGAILKMESKNGTTVLNALEVPISGVMTSWDNYSIDYTIAAGADRVVVGLGTSTGWGTANTTASSYLHDNVVVSGPVSTPAGLDPETEYAYYVKVRDTSVNANETGWSNPGISATTPATDYDIPTPAMMSFVSTDVSPTTVKLTAVTASDVTSSVKYYFTCTAGEGSDSGWQDSPVYYDTGLAPGSNYSYTVIARDTSFSKWSNTVSAVKNLTTMSVESGAFTSTLKGFTGNTDNLDDLMTVEKSGLTTGSLSSSALVEFDASGATFGDGRTYVARDVLRTIASGYSAVSFEAYATLTFAGQSDLSGFIGLGQGEVTGVSPNWGVPELELDGVNGVVAQFKDTTAGDIPNCQLFRFISGNPTDNGGTNIVSAPISSTETIRARLIYDAVAETVNVSFNKNYTGRAFVADQDMGTLSTRVTDTNAVVYSMWEGAPVRVYVGGGEGTTVSDFEIVVTSSPHPAFDVQVADIVAGKVVFTWEGTAGYIYEVQYKTNLVTGTSWTTDTSLGAADILSTGGSISATSTVDSASVFYRIISQ